MFHCLEFLTIKQDTEYFPPIREMKEYNVVINGQNFFDQSARHSKNCQQVKEMITQLLFYLTIIISKTIITVIDLSKQEAVDTDPKNNIAI